MVGITRVPAGAAEAISPQLGKLRASASSRILGTRKARLAVGVPTATVVGAIAEGTLWAHHPLVTAVNLLATALFVTTGVLLAEDPDQRGTALALIAAGITRPLGWLDQSLSSSFVRTSSTSEQLFLLPLSCSFCLAACGRAVAATGSSCSR